MILRALMLLCAIVFLPVTSTADEGRYRVPPPAVLSVLQAPSFPTVFVSPDGAVLLLATPLRYPPIADLARPMLRLAGMRIDPRSNGIHHAPSFTAFRLLRVADGRSIPVRLRANARAGAPVWNADGSQFAVWNARADGIDVLVGDARTGVVRSIPNVRLNALFANSIAWEPSGRRLLLYLVPRGRRPAPSAPQLPAGPIVDESLGVKAPAVTFEDLLKDEHDAALWEYYATGEWALVDPASGAARPLAPPGVYRSAQLSPSGAYALLDRVRRPYSFAAPYFAFPHDLLIVSTSKPAQPRRFAAIPLQTNATFEAVSTGPRGVHWRPDRPAMLVWSEAQDGGDPNTPASVRDIVYERDLLHDGQPRALVSLPDRFQAIEFVDGSSRAFVRAYDRASRFTRTLELDLDGASESAVTVSRLRDGDEYHDSGRLVTRRTSGEPVAQRWGNFVFLSGDGAGPSGLHPFVDRFDLGTHEKTRIFESPASPLESPLAILDRQGERILVRRQSPTDPPNEVVVTRGSERALTHFGDPTPSLRALGRRVVTYKRPDGIELSFTLYLPPNYKEGTQLPTLVWAYPREYNDPTVAGQTTNSAQTFLTLAGPSPIFAALAGYAVLDNASMPIVGDPRTVNDTFIEQLTADAKAAIDEAVALGVTDPQRVAVGGHSYGAFMTANLLAHTRLFRAGIARSGAYNRSLTPFGFQSERRTYWEATNLYTRISPFAYADKIVDPLLLIHGMADDNTGTFPIQSERLFAAIRGNGGTARLVFLPYEAHGYVARESVETTLAEMLAWLDRYLKIP
ncbi:MAG: S9 family peptidase [Candidatus Eremiobacteraeota bacterium]|nr:S9 family peptidase [Candidatus Eremiobacteraeota bacterium]